MFLLLLINELTLGRLSKTSSCAPLLADPQLSQAGSGLRLRLRTADPLPAAGATAQTAPEAPGRPAGAEIGTPVARLARLGGRTAGGGGAEARRRGWGGAGARRGCPRPARRSARRPPAWGTGAGGLASVGAIGGRTPAFACVAASARAALPGDVRGAARPAGPGAARKPAADGNALGGRGQGSGCPGRGRA